MTEHPGLRTPGRAIREAREGRGWSLADLSARTKIPPPVLTALEADEYHKVSGALYIKSFLRTCAAELGLDSEEILALYAGSSGSESSPKGGPDMVWVEDQVQISRIGLPWRSIGLTGAALVLIGLGVLGLTRGCGGADESPQADGADRASTAESRPVPRDTSLVSLDEPAVATPASTAKPDAGDRQPA
ncbi:helix-turn-helix domain-containing protein, partial [bacterium]|nr:helix-turn-helix domain-containing protein [bacterium]